VTAVGKGYCATLSSDMRGPLERKQATSWEQAFLKAKLLLDAAERRRDWYCGETVSVSVAQADE
jgi:hypothetical protein